MVKEEDDDEDEEDGEEDEGPSKKKKRSMKASAKLSGNLFFKYDFIILWKRKKNEHKC